MFFCLWQKSFYFKILANQFIFFRDIFISLIKHLINCFKLLFNQWDEITM